MPEHERTLNLYSHLHVPHMKIYNQTAWLRNGLANSTATWKFIISSDAFNIGLRMTVDTCLKIGNGNVPYWGAGIPGIPNYGYISWQNYGDCWAGFKEDADSLVKFVMTNNIKNVFMVRRSGLAERAARAGRRHRIGLTVFAVEIAAAGIGAEQYGQGLLVIGQARMDQLAVVLIEFFCVARESE